MTGKMDGPTEGPISAHDLEARTFAPLQFIVNGLIPIGLTVLAGAPKVGKSWLSLDIALSVARGTAILDEGEHRCGQGAVLYLALEDSERRLQGRLKQLMGKGPAWPRNLFFETAWPRMDADGLERLDRWVGETDGARLIVIDVFQKFRSLGSQAGYQQDYRDLAKLLDLARRHEIGIILVHHLRKSGGGDPFERVTGSAGFLGVPDTNMVLDKGRAGTRLLAQGRDIEEFRREVTFDPLALRWRLAQPRPIVKHPERARILDILLASAVPLAAGPIAAQTGQTVNTVSSMLGEMLAEGKIMKTGWGRYTSIPADNSTAGNQNAQNAQNDQSAQSAQHRPRVHDPNWVKRIGERERRARSH